MSEENALKPWLQAPNAGLELRFKEAAAMSMHRKDPRKDEDPSPEPIDPPTDIPPQEQPEDAEQEPNI